MVDLKALREAVESPWWSERAHGRYSQKIGDAVRALLDAPVVWWCEEHDAMDVGIHVSEGFCTIAASIMQRGLHLATECRMVRMALVRIGDGDG